MLDRGGKNVLIAGGSGLVGTRLTTLLINKGYAVKRLTRSKDHGSISGAFNWDPENAIIDAEAIPWADFIVNLAGENIAKKKWTHKRKAEIRKGRVASASLISNSLMHAENHVKAVISASAVGIYGDKMQVCTEETPPGIDFLAETCVDWENASSKINKPEIRKIIFRIGIVLSEKGGALKEMLRPFSFFTGLVFGNGNQVYSWIHIDDLCGMIIFALEHQKLSGTFNAVSPESVTNKEMIHTIARAKGGHYLFFSVPSFMMKLILGERSVIVLGSQQVSSKKIISSGYEFKFPELLKAIQSILS